MKRTALQYAILSIWTAIGVALIWHGHSVLGGLIVMICLIVSILDYL